MTSDNTAKLAKMMRMPEDALRAARLPEEKVNDIVRRARAARWRKLVIGSLAIALFVSAFVLANNDPAEHYVRQTGYLTLGSLWMMAVWAATKSVSKITAEAATAMQRRLVDLDQHCAS